MNAYNGPLLIAAVAFVLAVLEHKYPYRKGQRLLREGFWGDFLGYAIIQSYILGLVITHIIDWIDRGAGRLHFVSGWPVILQLGFFVVTHDLYIYWFHRFQHRSPIFWRIHEAHHSSPDVDWISGARSHALEILINQTIEFAPIVLLGAAPEVMVWKGIVSASWGMYIHSNIDVHSGWLQYIINGPEMHRWHHSDVEADGSHNFATKFAFWDWIFGTARRPPGKPAGYGLTGLDFPRSVLKQQLFAFRRGA